MYKPRRAKPTVVYTPLPSRSSAKKRAGAGADAQADAHADPGADAQADAHADPGADAQADAHADPGADAQADAHADPGADAQAGVCANSGVRASGVATPAGKSASQDPYLRAENEDDDGYDPYSDRREEPPLFERNPWD